MSEAKINKTLAHYTMHIYVFYVGPKKIYVEPNQAGGAVSSTKSPVMSCRHVCIRALK